jgi:hypothetical protein
MDLNDIRTNPAAEEQGTWIKIDSETSVLVARLGNKTYREVMQKAILKAREESGPKAAISDEQLVDILVESILLGWKGLKIAGEEIDYTPEKAREILMERGFKDFRALVVEMAGTAEHFRAEEIEAAAGN